jgi:hypothetical protein
LTLEYTVWLEANIERAMCVSLIMRSRIFSFHTLKPRRIW